MGAASFSFPCAKGSSLFSWEICLAFPEEERWLGKALARTRESWGWFLAAQEAVDGCGEGLGLLRCGCLAQADAGPESCIAPRLDLGCWGHKGTSDTSVPGIWAGAGGDMRAHLDGCWRGHEGTSGWVQEGTRGHIWTGAGACPPRAACGCLGSAVRGARGTHKSVSDLIALSLQQVFLSSL